MKFAVGDKVKRLPAYCYDGWFVPGLEYKILKINYTIEQIKLDSFNGWWDAKLFYLVELNSLEKEIRELHAMGYR